MAHDWCRPFMVGAMLLACLMLAQETRAQEPRLPEALQTVADAYCPIVRAAVLRVADGFESLLRREDLAEAIRDNRIMITTLIHLSSTVLIVARRTIPYQVAAATVFTLGGLCLVNDGGDRIDEAVRKLQSLL